MSFDLTGIRQVPGRTADSRTRLLDLTIGLAAQEGLGSVTVRRLCATAGMAPRTFYNYFADLPDVFLAASVRMHDELRAAIGTAYADGDGPADRARACIEALVEFVCVDPVRAEALFVQGSTGGVAVDTLRTETVAWAMTLVMGTAAPESTADDSGGHPRGEYTHRLLAEMAVGGVAAVVRRQVAQGELRGLVEATPHLVETVLRPYEWARRA